MWSSYQEMYLNINNDKLLIEKRLEMIRHANETGIKKEIFNAFLQASIKPFVDGAQWRINAVWHDISEIPKEGEHIVIVMENRCFTSWFVTRDIAMMFKKFRAVLWAYSRDLLPEGKEGK